MLPRVLGAVGARCLHLKVLSMKFNFSFASEYFPRSSIFWPDVPRNLNIIGITSQTLAKLFNMTRHRSNITRINLFISTWIEIIISNEKTKSELKILHVLPHIVHIKEMGISAGPECVIGWWSRKEASVQRLYGEKLVRKLLNKGHD